MVKKKTPEVSNEKFQPRRGSRAQTRKKAFGPLIGLLVAILVILGVAVFVLIQQNNSSKSSKKYTTASTSSGSAPASKFTEFIGNGFLGENTIKVGTTYYVFSSDTQTAPHVRLATSTDNVKFTASATDILPTLPSWSATPDKLTRPGIWKIGNQYIMYANYVNSASGFFAIGAATSATIDGTYTPIETPLLAADYGVKSAFFDVSIYQENGVNYLLYATDQDLGYDIWIQQLSDDGLSVVGNPTMIVDSTKIPQYKGSSNVALVERPALVKASDGKYVLFFSADKVDLNTSFVGYAVADTVTGPYTYADQFLSNTQMTGGLQGPSEPAVFQDGNKNYLIFNAWKGTHNSWDGLGSTATWNRYRTSFTWKNGHVPTLN